MWRHGSPVLIALIDPQPTDPTSSSKVQVRNSRWVSSWTKASDLLARGSQVGVDVANEQKNLKVLRRPIVVLWQILVTGALIASAFTALGDGVLNSPSMAGAASPSAAQVSTCSHGATGHSAMTKAQISACAGFPSIGEHCTNGPGVKVISVNQHNIAIRLGQAPVRLPKNYTVKQVQAVCSKNSKGPKRNGVAAPTPPSSGSSNSALKSVTIPPTFAGTAHPVFSPGKLGKLDIVYVGPAYSPGGDTSDGSVVPFGVWNGTSKTVDDLSASGTAILNEKVVGSGNSQDIEPPNLAPGQIAFGIIFFSTATPAGSAFNISVTSENQFSNTLVAQVTQANLEPGSFSNDMVGSVTNPNKTPMSGPISAIVYCFNAAGAFVSESSGFTSGNGPLAPGATASYDTTVEGTCTTYLVGSSGFTD